MAYENDTLVVSTYQIVGSMDQPYLSYGSNRADYNGNVLDLFHQTVCSKVEDAPKLIPGKSAFFIRYRKSSNGRNFNTREILALVETVHEYAIDPTNGMCKISFTFNEVPINTYDPTITRLNPIVSHIFVDHDFIAVVFEGDANQITEFVNQHYRTFTHAGKVYWMIDTLQYNAHLRDGEPAIDVERPALAVVVVASTLKVANAKNHEEFTAMLERYLNNIYGQNKGG